MAHCKNTRDSSIEVPGDSRSTKVCEKENKKGLWRHEEKMSIDSEPCEKNAQKKRSIFDFDAPKIKDFTGEKYQKQKKQIEKILIETDGGTRELPRAQKKAAGSESRSRATFFSTIYDKISPENIQRSSPFLQADNTTMGDDWFKRQEEKYKKGELSLEYELGHASGLEQEIGLLGAGRKGSAMFGEVDLFPSTSGNEDTEHHAHRSPSETLDGLGPEGMFLDKLRFMDTPHKRAPSIDYMEGIEGRWKQMCDSPELDLTPIKPCHVLREELGASPCIFRTNTGPKDRDKDKDSGAAPPEDEPKDDSSPSWASALFAQDTNSMYDHTIESPEMYEFHMFREDADADEHTEVLLATEPGQEDREAQEREAFLMKRLESHNREVQKKYRGEAFTFSGGPNFRAEGHEFPQKHWHE